MVRRHVTAEAFARVVGSGVSPHLVALALGPGSATIVAVAEIAPYPWARRVARLAAGARQTGSGRPPVVGVGGPGHASSCTRYLHVMTSRLRVFVGPKPDPDLADAVGGAGGTVVDRSADADLLVMTEGPSALRELDHEGLRYVQLPSAGVEGWFSAGVLRPGVTYLSAAGAYAPACAEHALALMLALVRRLDEFAHGRHWVRNDGGTLFGATVCIAGAGGIGKELIRLLQPFGVTIDAVSHSGRPVGGARRVLTADGLLEALAEADFVVNALPDTPATKGAIGAEELAAMKDTAYLINVGRGPTIDTDALVPALHDGTIAGAGLDVTDPEPLPDGHPLWEAPRALITCHTANPGSLNRAARIERAAENVRRLIAGDDLLGVIDLDRGY